MLPAASDKCMFEEDRTGQEQQIWKVHKSAELKGVRKQDQNGFCGDGLFSNTNRFHHLCL